VSYPTASSCITVFGAKDDHVRMHVAEVAALTFLQFYIQQFSVIHQ